MGEHTSNGRYHLLFQAFRDNSLKYVEISDLDRSKWSIASKEFVHEHTYVAESSVESIVKSS